MNCPSCGKRLSLLSVREQFSCPNCRSALHYPFWTVYGWAGLVGSLVWFVLDQWLEPGWLIGSLMLAACEWVATWIGLEAKSPSIREKRDREQTTVS
jgi:hypothetical protein